MEIYAPKDYTRGAYINDFSYFNGESEILLDGGTEFKVVDEYDFTIFHMFGEDRGQIVAGDVEGPLRYNKTDKGIEVIITSLSPFAIHWSKNISDSQESQEGEEDKDTAKPSDNGNHSVGLLHIW